MQSGAILLMGGSDGAPRNDAWKSTNGGSVWAQVWTATDWPARQNHAMIALQVSCACRSSHLDGALTRRRRSERRCAGCRWVRQRGSRGHVEVGG